MNVELVFRLGGAALFAVGGWYLGSIVEFPFSPLTWLPLNLLGAGVGSIAGCLCAPFQTAAGRMIFAHVRENHREGQLA